MNLRWRENWLRAFDCSSAEVKCGPTQQKLKQENFQQRRLLDRDVYILIPIPFPPHPWSLATSTQGQYMSRLNTTVTCIFKALLLKTHLNVILGQFFFKGKYEQCTYTVASWTRFRAEEDSNAVADDRDGGWELTWLNLVHCSCFSKTTAGSAWLYDWMDFRNQAHHR